MTKRLYVTPTNFRMSKAGFDASTALPPSEIIFDLINYRYNSPLVSGTISTSGFTKTNFSVTGAAEAFTLDGSVSLGKTFLVAPQVMVGAIDNTGDAQFGSALSSIYSINDSSYPPGAGAFLNVSASCTTTVINLRVVYIRYAGSGYTTNNITLCYLAFRI